ncbi:MAG TPA: preprotein translocase subunit SecA [Nitrospiria bacterium]|nr:preprotein translocase subunit SecA [Nitrospiria bacterium]
MLNLLKKIFGSKNDRELKRLWPLVHRINAMEPSVSPLTDENLRAKTVEFRKRIADGETLDEILPEAFAVAREGAKRSLGMRHFDVQLLGGVVLHEGKIAEMKTGEGKTLVATLPVYLNALAGKGVHVVTVNDYLARRDSQWMGQLYTFLGLTVGTIQHDLDDAERQVAYGCDVTYGTNNEYGFDYLRDNMKFDPSTFVQRELFYGIVDEVDSILIDEARTPLIISGPAEDSTDLYYRVDKIIPLLKFETDYTIDEKSKTAALTDEGNARVEMLLGVANLYDLSNISLVHHVQQALRGHVLFKRDVDYVVKDGEVLIVDEFTGRLMPGRRWSDGLHQAIEAKEGVKIANENQTLATITFQNYFRMYKKLSGMTGTADTEAAEFNKIYNLDVVVGPANRPMVRADYPDVIYRTEQEKFNAISEEIEALHEKGQPVLVGTISIEKSEKLSGMLKRKGVRHSVLNAKFHEKEAEIIAQAGRKTAVTIATNMAGRGTDILLGGNPEFIFRKELEKFPDITHEQSARKKEELNGESEREKQEVIALGGLHIIGTERHESRRIDNQLRGRSGRQGDPGSSRFYLSLEDDLLRIFGSDRISGVMARLGMEEGVPIEARIVSKAIENAQKKVEAHNFDIRKQLIEYDDVMNKQREVIYEQRKQILKGEEVREEFLSIVDERVEEMVSFYCDPKAYAEEWDLKGLAEGLQRQFSVSLDLEKEIKGGETGHQVLKDTVAGAVRLAYDEKEKELGTDLLQNIMRQIMLATIDSQWKDHLLGMDHLKEGIGLRGYGQKDPLVEYKREGFEMFSAMIDRVRSEMAERFFKVKIRRDAVPTEQLVHRPKRMILNRGEEVSAGPVHRDAKKVGRNEDCPCGSGRKYKRCHGQ